MQPSSAELQSGSSAEILDDDRRIHPGLRLLAGIGGVAAAGLGLALGLEFAVNPSNMVADVSAVGVVISVADAAGLGYIAARGKIPFIHSCNQ